MTIKILWMQTKNETVTIVTDSCQHAEELKKLLDEIFTKAYVKLKMDFYARPDNESDTPRAGSRKASDEATDNGR